MANRVGHIELTTSDLNKAKSFYTELFGWQFQDHPMPDGKGVYALHSTQDGAAAGMMASPPGAPTAWTPFINVDDVAAATKKAKDLGGNVIRDVVPVSGYGEMSIVADPTGAVFGLWESKS